MDYARVTKPALIACAETHTFKANLQKVRIIDENGNKKRVWVSAHAIKAGLVTRA